MTDSPILLDRHDDGVAVLTFNRPEAHNALSLAAMRHFADAIDTLAGDQSLRALVLTGAGSEAFCSGGDLYELGQMPTEDDARGFITTMGDALLAIERLPVPVIAAINGYALGGGSEIAVACDLRVVDDQARMGFVQIRLALSPGWGAGQRLLRLVGYATALEILLEGRPIHADELLALGLANQVTEHGKALDQALHIARKAAEHDADTVRAIKTLLRAGLTQSYDDALATERELFPPLWAAEPHLRAVENFLNRERKRNGS